MGPSSLKLKRLIASWNFPLEGKSLGFENEQTLSTQVNTGKRISKSERRRAIARMVWELLEALMAQILAASLSIQAIIRRPANLNR